jgi:hypothetical protein
MADAGVVLASVTLTVPDCVAVNVRIAVPCGAIEPSSFSVTGDVGVEGAVVAVVSLLLHAVPSAAHARSPTIRHFIRVAILYVKSL